ncbi:MAG: hypothetical protein GY913_05480 [Proteobacteria bacterium]|nr:hypothetical protein [Pseudomonadota bacterium]MCP4916354.1 hypothetical protein [Pseudomonadota bacterium]
MLLLLVACADPPDPCDPMCAEAAALYGDCLADWGVGWDAAGYEDASDYEGRCTTWAWEARVLEEDAVERGQAELGDVDAVCDERLEALSVEDASCDVVTSMEWTVPWE